MTQIIQYSLGIALWGSLVCLAVLLARPLIKKISNRFMRLLWVIVIVRFLCPLAIESPIPIVWTNTSESYSKSNVENDLSIKNENNSVGKNSSDTLERPIQVDLIPLDSSGATTAETSVRTSSGASVESETRTMEMSSDTSNDSKVERNDKSTSKSFSIASIGAWFASDFGQMILMICGIAWVIGSVALLAIGAYKYWMICRSLDEAIFVKKWKNYPVKVTDYSGVPMSFGIFHPEIYLPPSFDDCDSVKRNATFSFRQKKMILLHEGMHLKHHDPLLKLVTYIMLAMHWWNPLVWLCVKYINIDIEMACDEAVLAKIGRRNRGEYAEALFSFAMKQSGISMIASFGESNAESRIKNTLRFRKPTMLGTALAMILVLGLSGCLALNPFGTGEKKQDDGTDQEVISEQLQANETPENAIPENDNENSGALADSDHVQTDEYSDVKSETNEVDATGTTDTENISGEKISLDSPASLYEGFKNGTEKLYFDRFQGEESGDFTTEVRNVVENGKGYSLSEFKKLVCGVYEWEENETTVKFDDLDCGQDGVMEMAMKIEGPYASGYGNSTYYIIKESEGRLYCTFGFDEFGRTGASLNKVGYYSQWGSMGAVTHGGECGILDADGVYHLNYKSEEDGIYSNWKDKIDENLVGADEILRNTFHLEGEYDLLYCTVHTTKKDYACFFSETVSDDEIYDALTKAGMNVMHWNEIKKIMDEVSAGNGYTEEMENAPELFSYMYVD